MRRGRLRRCSHAGRGGAFSSASSSGPTIALYSRTTRTSVRTAAATPKSVPTMASQGRVPSHRSSPQPMPYPMASSATISHPTAADLSAARHMARVSSFAGIKGCLRVTRRRATVNRHGSARGVDSETRGQSRGERLRRARPYENPIRRNCAFSPSAEGAASAAGAVAVHDAATAWAATWGQVWPARLRRVQARLPVVPRLRGLRGLPVFFFDSPPLAGVP